MNNTTARFGHNAQAFATTTTTPLEIVWQNTPSAIASGSTIPTNLFVPSNTAPMLVTARGVDLSALTTALVFNSGVDKFLFDSCRIASGVNPHKTAPSPQDLVENSTAMMERTQSRATSRRRSDNRAHHHVVGVATTMSARSRTS
jgi:hypothetical protein